ncbi:MAG: hypothetical protein DRJ07_15570 [Bacteroidetes bacterium]|nr:MAG: hypothetical protein DRJ07_15570 [Bacteroidota bacterium]
MDKLLATIIFLLSIQFTFATDYYISSSIGDDNNNGISAATPWKTFTKIQAFSFSPGDNILLKKGDVWNQTFKIYSAGTVIQPIVVSSYGTGEMPIVDVVADHNNLGWMGIGNNLWSTLEVPYDPKRLLIDGVEVLDAATDLEYELGTNIPDLVQYYYDDELSVFNIYSTDSPTNHDIKFSSEPYALVLSNDHNITIENIEFIGGYRICVAISSCSGITLRNLKVGKYANFGIQMGSYKVNGVNFQLCENVIIDNCIVDSGYTFDYSDAGTVGYTSDRGPREGVLFRGTINCELKNSLVKNYCHANLNIFAPATEPGGDPLDERVVQDCKIYNNTFTSPDIAYGGRAAIDGFCFNNEIYNNLFIDTSVQNQFNGYDNHIHHNIFKRIKSSPLKAWATGNAIAVQGYYLEVKGNVFENNLMIDCESAGFYISGNNGYGDISDNTFRNNSIYNCGTADNNIGIEVATDSNNYSNHGNIFENNLVYNENTDETISFYDTIMNIETLNDNDNTNGYTISNNIGENPLFVEVIEEDFHLQSNSPCIDAGTTPLATSDWDSNAIPFPNTLPDIGIYEFQGTLGLSDEVFDSNLFIYPNPVSNILFIKNKTNEVIEIVTIFDITGKLVYNKTIESNSTQISLNIFKLKPGFYILNLKSNLNTYTKKINKK